MKNVKIIVVLIYILRNNMNFILQSFHLKINLNNRNLRLVELCVSIALLFITTIASGQNVGINSTGATPDASAMLDIIASDKGLLIPRVALTATDAAGPITSPTTSLLIYNTATAGSGATAVTPGYYYWTGSQWSRVLDAASGKPWLLTGNAGTVAGTNFIGTTDAIDFVVKTNNTEKFRVQSGGNVGIGTTTPNQFGKFAVKGGVAATSNSSAAFITLGAAQGERANIALYSTFTGTSDNGPRRTADIIAGYNGGAWGYEYLSFNIGTSSDAGAITAEKMRITSAGNVGIGTTTPTYKLEVQGGNIRASGEIISTMTTGSGQFRAVNGNYGVIIRNDGGNTYLPLLTASGDQYGGWNTLRPLRIDNATGDVLLANATSIFKHSNGYVGIGTITPSYRLDVAHTIRAKDVFDAGGQNIIVGDDSFLSDIDVANTMGVYGNTNTDRGGIRFGSGGATIFGINNRIGINTIAPQDALHVIGNIRLGTFGQIATNDGNGRLSIYSNAATNTYLNSEGATRLTLTQGNFAFYSATAGTAGTAITWGNPNVYFQNNGNVGIGTTVPGAKLEIRGNVKIVDGTQGANKVLTSDANGLSSWQARPASAQATSIAALSTTSTTWTDMTNMLVTLTTSGGNILISFTTQETNTDVAITAFRFVIDGTEVNSAIYGNAINQEDASSVMHQKNIAATWLATGVTAGSHTVKVQWKVTSGTAYAPEAGEESARTLTVIEIK